MAVEGGPLPIVQKPSNYGQEAETQRLIGQAAQYNPATKLGITNEDQPSKKANSSVPDTQKQISAEVKGGGKPVKTMQQGFGPKSGLEPMGEAPTPQEMTPRGPSFASATIAEHYAHLAALPNASPIVKYYAGKSNRAR